MCITLNEVNFTVQTSIDGINLKSCSKNIFSDLHMIHIKFTIFLYAFNHAKKHFICFCPFSLLLLYMEKFVLFF